MSGLSVHFRFKDILVCYYAHCHSVPVYLFSFYYIFTLYFHCIVFEYIYVDKECVSYVQSANCKFFYLVRAFPIKIVVL